MVSGAGSMSANGAFRAAPASLVPALLLESPFTPDFDSATHNADSKDQDVSENEVLLEEPTSRNDC